MRGEKIKRLLDWMDESTCNYLAVACVAGELEEHGFKELYQNEDWEIRPGGKYFMKKNDSALFAFTIGEGGLSSFRNGTLMISAHSDSPCLRLKPNPEIYGEGGAVSLNVEKYGGGILYTWFDRPLSMAGRVTLQSEDLLHPEVALFDYKRPIAVVPHLAIHFNRGVNDGNPLSVQKDMKPVVGYFSSEEIKDAREGYGIILPAIAEGAGIEPEQIIDYDVSLYPCEAPRLCGLDEEYIMSGRLDDLSMVFAGLEALLSSTKEEEDCRHVRLFAIFDNEETGSGTRQGAASPVVRDLMERILESLGGGKEDFHVGMANSFMISADNAHAWHPNYNEKYDPTNHPVIGGGPVIKVNTNGKYMTDSVGATVFKRLCEEAGVKWQMFVNHSDVAGGSTLGNILTSQMDINGVDVGSPIWAMHSAMETGGVSDHLDMIKVFERFWKG
ncbi:MAG: M18 family aminopeptidase [Muribaculaceae bacterium]|nr:M18 family aminopeptidase [Muribaculaceae bacterium]